MKLDHKGLDRAGFMMFVQASRDDKDGNSDWHVWTRELKPYGRGFWRQQAREIVTAYLGQNPHTGKWEGPA